MAVSLLSDDLADEDHIDMEISSFSRFFCHSSLSPPPQTTEFEFQMSSSSVEKEPTNSPADELFYKGKLLPLHLPPRLQMVEKLLQNSNFLYEDKRDNFNEFYSTPLATALTTPTATSTPFESCNISPSESCRVSRELNPGEYFDNPSEVRGFVGENSKKSWTRKLKLIKQSSFGSKLKASRSYLKGLFGKSGYSDESCKAAAKVADEDSISQAKGNRHKYTEAAKTNPSRESLKEKYQIPTASGRSFDREKITEKNARHHRRSFSLAIRRQPTNWFSPSSSSSSDSSLSSTNSSNGFQALPYLKRSNSVNSEIENPIQEAIAHCKQSQKQTRKTVSEVGFYSLPTSRISMFEEQERLYNCTS